MYCDARRYNHQATEEKDSRKEQLVDGLLKEAEQQSISATRFHQSSSEASKGTDCVDQTTANNDNGTHARLLRREGDTYRYHRFHAEPYKKTGVCGR